MGLDFFVHLARKISYAEIGNANFKCALCTALSLSAVEDLFIRCINHMVPPYSQSLISKSETSALAQIWWWTSCWESRTVGISLFTPESVVRNWWWTLNRWNEGGFRKWPKLWLCCHIWHVCHLCVSIWENSSLVWVEHFRFVTCNYYRPQWSCEGYVFTGVCLFTGGGCLLRGMPGWGGCLVPGGACYMSRFVSVGDALGWERPATPMSSYFAGHSGCAVT